MNAQTRQVIRVGLLVLALAALVLLVTGLPQLALEPGLPFERILQFLLDQLGNRPRGYPVPGPMPGGELLMRIYRAIFWVALAAFPFSVILMLLDKDLRKRVFATVVRIALLVLLLTLIMQNRQPVEMEDLEPVGIAEPGASPGEVEPIEAGEFAPDAVSPWIGRGLSLALGGVAALILVAIVSQIIKVYRDRSSGVEELARSAKAALSELEGGGDYQDIILRCYAEMSRVVREVRGLRRGVTVTAREFTDVLVGAHLPPSPVSALTALFERARYGKGATKPGDEETAVRSLRAIVRACEELGSAGDQQVPNPHMGGDGPASPSPMAPSP